MLNRPLRLLNWMGRGALVATALSLTVPSVAIAAEPITEQDAHAIAIDAYLYFYPLVTMDLTRKQLTNVEAGKEPLKGPMNTFVNIPEYPPPISKVSCDRTSIHCTRVPGSI
jgi:hypothetical protein